MKKITTILILILVFFMSNSCSKALDSIADCAGESLLVKLEHTPDASNSKKINFSFYYGNSNGTVKAVTWDFGDGSPAVAGKDVSHTYNETGTYTVKVQATVRSDDTDCGMTPQRTITVK